MLTLPYALKAPLVPIGAWLTSGAWVCRLGEGSRRWCQVLLSVVEGR